MRKSDLTFPTVITLWKIVNNCSLGGYDSHKGFEDSQNISSAWPTRVEFFNLNGEKEEKNKQGDMSCFQDLLKVRECHWCGRKSLWESLPRHGFREALRGLFTPFVFIEGINIIRWLNG